MMQCTLKMLPRITHNYDEQAKSLGEVRQMQKEMEASLGALEAKPVGSSVVGSTADTDQGHQPAIIIGGWYKGPRKCSNVWTWPPGRGRLL